MSKFIDMNKIPGSTLLLSFIIAVLSIEVAIAKPPNTIMTPVDILNIPELSSPVISPDKKRAIYIRKDADWEKNKQVANLWLTELASGQSRQLTFDSVNKSDATWSPDGRFISFVAKRKGDEHRRLYLLPVAGGEAFAAGDHDSKIKQYRWSKDSRSVYFLANEPYSEQIKKRKETKDDMFPYEQSLSYSHLWKLDVQEETITKITDGQYFVRSFDLSSDNSIIAFSRASAATIDARHSADIWVMPVSTGKARRVTDNQFAESSIQISPDNNKILFISDVNEKGEFYYDANLFIVSIAKGDITPIALDQSFEVEYARWSKKGNTIYVKANMGVRSELWELGVKNNRARQLTNGKHTVKSWRYDASIDQHALVLTTPVSHGDIWRLPGKGGKLTALTKINADLERQFRLPEQQLVRWKGTDGAPLEGLLTLPLDYEKGKRYPLVVHTHGGPRSSDQYGQLWWRTYIPVLASMGYAYFTPNYRGGRGYGDEFMRDMVGGYFNNAHLDVMSGVDYLIEHNIADPDKLLAVGWSAGGHMTNKLITFTDRFRAASSGAGAVDWASMYGHTDTRYGRTDWFGGTPWQKNAPLDVYKEHSPLKDLWKVKTPTLIFVGEKDIRVPPAQSIILFRALKDLGVETQLYVAPRESHGFKELRHRLFKINAELAWFERHALARDYEWQDPPE